MSEYWDPRVEAERLVRDPTAYFGGVWEERNWLNVPGPFYGAFTDTCCCGVPAAPRNVLYDENAMEFVWRQPTTREEVVALLDAAYQDPFIAYNWDGNDRWTPDLVMQWWDGRERVELWIASAEFDWLGSDMKQRRLASDGLTGFREYLHGSLGEDLRRYAAWLASR